MVEKRPPGGESHRYTDLLRAFWLGKTIARLTENAHNTPPSSVNYDVFRMTHPGLRQGGQLDMTLEEELSLLNDGGTLADQAVRDTLTVRDQVNTNLGIYADGKRLDPATVDMVLQLFKQEPDA